MNKALRISLTARLRVIADELAPGITDEDIETWVDLFEVPIDGALQAARVEGLIQARNAVWPHRKQGIGPDCGSVIQELIEAENDSLES